MYVYFCVVFKNYVELGNLYYIWNVLLICFVVRLIEIYCFNLVV